uniref:Uncharacterized protein n=1 Tax=Glossina austeni TaxID=7395 RepID=A0A1A9VC63_GLOAU
MYCLPKFTESSETNTSQDTAIHRILSKKRKELLIKGFIILVKSDILLHPLNKKSPTSLSDIQSQRKRFTSYPNIFLTKIQFFFALLFTKQLNLCSAGTGSIKLKLLTKLKSLYYQMHTIAIKEEASYEIEVACSEHEHGTFQEYRTWNFSTYISPPLANIFRYVTITTYPIKQDVKTFVLISVFLMRYSRIQTIPDVHV